MQHYKHSTQIQLRFKDGDLMGHVNNANHFTYFELARVTYFKEVVGDVVNWKNEGIILARMVIDYKAPLLITDSTFASTRCTRLGDKSFDLEHLLIVKNNGDEKIIATGTCTLVCYNYINGVSISIPDEWRGKMQVYDRIN